MRHWLRAVLLDTHIAADIRRRFLRVQASVSHLDNMFQLSGLLFYLGSEEECGRSNDLMDVPTEVHECPGSGMSKIRHDVQTVLTFLWNLVNDWTM